jgi:UDP-glucoronosyl and UDP-glucosyl transferase
LLGDNETKALLNSEFDLLIIDASFPECIMGLQHRLNVPFMFFNVVGFFTEFISRSGSPMPFATTPHFTMTFTDDMTFYERLVNAAVHISFRTVHQVGFTFNPVLLPLEHDFYRSS